MRLVALVMALAGCGRIGFDPLRTDDGGVTSRCGFVEVAGGRSHTCARRANGTIACWGDNTTRQIMTPASLGPTTPLDIPLTRPAIQLALGAFFTCALLDDGSVECWGANSYGELGDATGVIHADHVLTLPPGDVVQIVAGADHACARHLDGGVTCWGDNVDGQIGVGAKSQLEAPTRVPGLTGVVGIAAGHRYTCAWLGDGTARCWGWNVDAQLGDGTVIDRPSPTMVMNLAGTRAMSGGGRHGCGLRDTGDVYCWGENEDGQEGTSDIVDDDFPTRRAVLPAAAMQIVSGGRHTCALLVDATVWCWGNGTAGQVGNGTLESEQTTPVRVPITGAVVSLSAGHKHTCALLATGDVQCWGASSNGELGDGARAIVAAPTVVATSVTTASTGTNHACAISANRLLCWGSNTEGRVGTGTTLGVDQPTQIALANPMSLGVGIGHTCALDATNKTWCWGANWANQLGVTGNLRELTPVVATALPGTTSSLGAGNSHTCAIENNFVTCFGYNASGVLGDGTTTGTGPTTPAMLANPLQLAGGDEMACARLVGGAIRCWGANNRGQLGDGTTTNRSIPTLAATNVSGPLTIATAGRHACAIDAASALWCWGGNGDGQLGDGTQVTRLTPVMVQGLPGTVTDVAVGDQHTCAVVANGDVWCWGDNRVGELGSDPNVHEILPVLIPGAGPAMRVYSRGSFTCALGTDAALRCWGRNDTGQVGVDTSAHTMPTSVRCGL